MGSNVTVTNAQSSLFLRLFSAEAAPSWRQWGKPVHDGSGLWRFPISSHEHLLDLVEVLTLQTPAHELNKIVAFRSPAGSCDKDPTIPLAALGDCLPLPVLHARLHHPWITEDLAAHVETHLQPIVDLLRRGRVFAYEALCRVHTPSGKLLSGYEVFTLAKQAYRTKAMDLAAIKSALLAKANHLGDGTPIFINILPQNLTHLDSVCSPLREFLQSLGISPQQVVIELVESEQVDPEALVDSCDALRGMGFRIALDDVGAGYNGLTTLATLRPDFVKFDRNLVDGIQGSRVRMVLLEALISMAQRLGCATIAEGLERVEDVLLCQDMGVNYAQGYFFARPSPVPEIPDLLPHHRTTASVSLKGTIRLADYVDQTPTVPTTATVEEVRALFEKLPELPYVVILDGRQPIGYAFRSDLSCAKGSRLATNYSHPTTRILKDRVPKSSISQRFVMQNRRGEPWIVVNDDDEYLGAVEPSVVLLQIIAGAEKGEVHPLSLLPTGPVLRSTIDMHLQADEEVELIYIDIDNFKAFNDRYGFVRGDAMIKLLSEIVRQERSTWPDAYVGHIGGDDFIVMLSQSAPNLQDTLQSVMESFHRLSAYLYDSKDLQNGFFETQEGDRHPVAALSIVVVNGSQGNLQDIFKASERTAKLKKMAKACRGSAIVMDGDPPSIVPVPLSGHEEGSWQDYAVEILSQVSRYRRDSNHHDLDAVFKSHPYFELIYELDDCGIQPYPNWVSPQMRGRIKGGGAGTNRSSKPYFREVLQKQVPYVSGVYVSSASEDFCVTVSVPLSEVTGAFQGVLVADINLPGLVELFRTPLKF